MKRKHRPRKMRNDLVADLSNIRDPINLNELRNTQISIRESGRTIGRYKLPDLVRKFW